MNYCLDQGFYSCRNWCIVIVVENAGTKSRVVAHHLQDVSEIRCGIFKEFRIGSYQELLLVVYSL
jgi:hypothetical protein